MKKSFRKSGRENEPELHLSLTVMTLKRPHAARWCNFLQHRSDVCVGAAGST